MTFFVALVMATSVNAGAPEVEAVIGERIDLTGCETSIYDRSPHPDNPGMEMIILQLTCQAKESA
ncbi:MAG: hypothetical protein KI788_06340 [Mameliella sp.]|nr:hypothetical protein [Mameliella sp.]